MQTQISANPSPKPSLPINIEKLDAKEQRIVILLTDQINGLYNCADAIREMIRERGQEWPEQFEEKQNLFTANFVRKIALVGISRTPLTALGAQPGVKALGRLPLDEQKRLEREPVIVLMANGDTMPMDVHNLTKDQSRQVFDKDHVRTIPEQKAWIESEKMKFTHALTPLKEAQEYEIRGKKLIVRGVSFTASQLQKILKQIKG